MKYKEGLWHEHVYFYQEDLVKDPNVIFANITLHNVSSLSRLDCQTLSARDTTSNSYRLIKTWYQILSLNKAKQ